MPSSKPGISGTLIRSRRSRPFVSRCGSKRTMCASSMRQRDPVRGKAQGRRRGGRECRGVPALCCRVWGPREIRFIVQSSEHKGWLLIRCFSFEVSFLPGSPPCSDGGFCNSSSHPSKKASANGRRRTAQTGRYRMSRAKPLATWGRNSCACGIVQRYEPKNANPGGKPDYSQPMTLPVTSLVSRHVVRTSDPHPARSPAGRAFRYRSSPFGLSQRHVTRSGTQHSMNSMLNFTLTFVEMTSAGPA